MLKNILHIVFSWVNLLRLCATALLFCLLASCKPATEQEKIDAINKRIAPEGYLTKTHLYISWPAYTVGDQVKDMEEVQGKERYKRPSEYYQKVILEPLKLKIPIEYVLDAVFYGDLPKRKIDRFLGSSLLIFEHKILSVSLSMDKQAKPVEPIVYQHGVKDMEKYKQQLQFNTISISRGQIYGKSMMTREYWDNRTNLEKETAGRYIREANVDGLERYVELDCFDLIGNSEQTQKDYLGRLSVKAKDDKAPSHCFSRRERQFLVPPAEIANPEYPIVISCLGVCRAELSLQDREVTMFIFKENRFDYYEYIEHEKHEKARLQGDNAPYYGVQQPLLDQVYTDLPKWREKVTPILPLIQSIVRPQSEVFPSLDNPNIN